MEHTRSCEILVSMPEREIRRVCFIIIEGLVECFAGGGAEEVNGEDGEGGGDKDRVQELLEFWGKGEREEVGEDAVMLG